MGAPAIAEGALPPQAELSRLARILARFLAGTELTSATTQVAGRAAGHGLDFLDFRGYQPGDDFRRIDWRASARGRDVMVRRYSGDLASDWFVCVDASASMGVAGGGKWTLARQLAAALSYILLELGHRVGVLLFSTEVDALCPLGRGSAQYAHILGLLDSHEPRPRGGRSDISACSSVLGRRQPLFLISDFLAQDAMLESLAGLLARQRQMHLLQLSVPGELQLPDIGDLQLQDVESGRTVNCSDPHAAQDRARQELASLRESLSAWCRGYGLPLTSNRDDETWRDILLRHFIGSTTRLP
jgi:uncharacterized protein (DUF58 family)